MNEMTTLVANGDRAEMAKTFGMWTGKNASASDLVSWASERIAIYEKWIKNCRKLKDENQRKLLDGIPVEVLQKMIDDARQGN